MSLFKQFNNEKLTLVKKNGERYEDIMASVQSDMIFIDDTSLPIEEDDTFIRKLPNGLVEKYTVLDRGYFEKVASMPAHYQVKVQKQTNKSPSNSNKIIYNLGDNSRVNINSNDSSINIINMDSNQLFSEIKSKIKTEIDDDKEKKKLLEKLEQLENVQNKDTFSKKYAEFMALAANHATVLYPYFQALGQMLA